VVGQPGDEEAVEAAASSSLTARVSGELAAATVAARFAKADLVSQVVIEFPSLQGRVGGIYAAHAGAAPAVSQAIAEHYQPLSAVAPIPGALGGGLVAVADKIDNIAGAWVTGEKPSGSRDPYGLRRAAMGIVRIALEQGLHIVPRDLADRAFAAYTDQGRPEPEGHPRAEIAAFIWERLEGLLLDEGLPFPLVEAALGAVAHGADLPRVADLAHTFARVQQEPYFGDVVVAYTRPSSLAAKAEAEPGVPAEPDPALFSDEAEHVLADALAEVRAPFAIALSGGDVEAALAVAAALRAPIDRYFDDVLVMDKDPAVRANRLAQLRQITALLGRLGDFSRLPVQQG
jgi:glycyl-tRNA synthetase beta chain